MIGVGVNLHNSRGSVAGGNLNLVQNWDFSNGLPPWIEGTTTTATIETSQLKVQNIGAASGRVYQAVSLVNGVDYIMWVDIIYNGGFARAEIYTAPDQSMNGSQINVNSSGTYSHLFTANADTMYLHLGNRSDANMFNKFDNIILQRN